MLADDVDDVDDARMLLALKARILASIEATPSPTRGDDRCTNAVLAAACAAALALALAGLCAGAWSPLFALLVQRGGP